MSCPYSLLKTSRCMVLSHSNEKLDSALAMVGLVTQVHAVFAVAVARGGGGARTPHGPANPFSPTARAAKTLRGGCAAIRPRF
jgi:hypothetical protein